MTEENDIQLEEGSAEVTLQDIYAMFYIMVKQNQTVRPGSKICFNVKAFKNLPKKVSLNFQRVGNKLQVWIPEKPKDRQKKPEIIVPTYDIITPN